MWGKWCLEWPKAVCVHNSDNKRQHTLSNCTHTNWLLLYSICAGVRQVDLQHMTCCRFLQIWMWWHFKVSWRTRNSPVCSTAPQLSQRQGLYNGMRSKVYHMSLFVVIIDWKHQNLNMGLHVDYTHTDSWAQLISPFFPFGINNDILKIWQKPHFKNRFKRATHITRIGQNLIGSKSAKADPDLLSWSWWFCLGVAWQSQMLKI